MVEFPLYRDGLVYDATATAISGLDLDMTDITQIRDAFTAVKSAIESFNATWPSHVRCANAYLLDRQDANDFNRNPSAITVTPVTGEVAVSSARDMFAALYRGDGQNNIGVTQRLPGLIALDCDPLPLISPVNAAKDHLETLLAQYPLPTNPVSRHRAYKALLGDVVVLQVLRRLHGLPLPLPHRLTFTWIARSSGSRTLTRDMAEDLIRAHHEARTHDSARPAALAADLARLAMAGPGDRLMTYKPVAPNPRLIVYASKGATPDPTLTASLPIFLHWPEGTDFPLFSPLESLDIDAALKADTKRARKPRTLLVPSISLYTQANA